MAKANAATFRLRQSHAPLHVGGRLTALVALVLARAGCDRQEIESTSQMAFDAAGPGRNLATHPSQMLIDDGRVRVWYVGEEALAPFRQRIGMLEADLN